MKMTQQMKTTSKIRTATKMKTTPKMMATSKWRQPQKWGHSQIWPQKWKGVSMPSSTYFSNLPLKNEDHFLVHTLLHITLLNNSFRLLIISSWQFTITYWLPIITCWLSTITCCLITITCWLPSISSPSTWRMILFSVWLHGVLDGYAYY